MVVEFQSQLKEWSFDRDFTFLTFFCQVTYLFFSYSIWSFIALLFPFYVWTFLPIYSPFFPCFVPVFFSLSSKFFYLSLQSNPKFGMVFHFLVFLKKIKLKNYFMRQNLSIQKNKNHGFSCAMKLNNCNPLLHFLAWGQSCFDEKTNSISFLLLQYRKERFWQSSENTSSRVSFQSLCTYFFS